jgi:hypothetical protein
VRCSDDSLGRFSEDVLQALVDAALAYKLPFAVVPCCVFRDIFPDRKLVSPNGHVLGVKKYNCFLQYLQKKHPGIERAQLGFKGRDVVLFMRSSKGYTEVNDLLCHECE